MKIRALKIAVSAVSVLACLLLLILWLRSHWVCDSVTWNGGHRVAVLSGYGQIRVSISSNLTGSPLLRWSNAEIGHDGIGPWFFQAGQSMLVVFPHRLPIVVLMLLAAVPWIHWRYSLRTLLIAVTVVALVLGLLFAF